MTSIIAPNPSSITPVSPAAPQGITPVLGCLPLHSGCPALPQGLPSSCPPSPPPRPRTVLGTERAEGTCLQTLALAGAGGRTASSLNTGHKQPTERCQRDTRGKAVYSSDPAHKQSAQRGEQTGKKGTEEKNKCLCLRLSFAFGQPRAGADLARILLSFNFSFPLSC